MRVFAIIILRVEPSKRIVCSAYNLETFGYFQRSAMQEFFNFTASTIGERTEKGLRQSVEHNQYIAHAYRLSTGICGIVICEKNYPTRVAFSLVSRALDVFSVEIPSEQVEQLETSVKLDKIDELLRLYQDPVQADPILRVQKDLDETKIVLVHSHH